MGQSTINEAIRGTMSTNWLLANTCNHLTDVDEGTFWPALWHGQRAIAPMQLILTHLKDIPASKLDY
jgi:hypothetical protein